MVGFLEELAEVAGCKPNELVNTYKIALLANTVLYVQGFTKIISFTDDNIVIKVPGNVLSIDGAKFQIESLGRDDVVIHGRILSISTMGGNNE